jgi:peptide/nickel transport system permease protein
MLKRYLLRRLLHFVFLLAGISALSFILLDLAPGDFLGEAKLNPQIAPQTIAALRHQYGLDQSIGQKYVYWLGSVVKGDFGISFAYDLPVSILLWPRAIKTLELTLGALVISWLLAVPLGVLSAAARDGVVDRIVSSFVTVLLAIPDLILACLVLIVAVRSGTFHSGSPILPITVLVLGALPMLVRHTRSTLLSAASQPFARAARANGLSGYGLWFGWLLPAAANPLYGTCRIPPQRACRARIVRLLMPAHGERSLLECLFVVTAVAVLALELSLVRIGRMAIGAELVRDRLFEVAALVAIVARCFDVGSV